MKKWVILSVILSLICYTIGLFFYLKGDEVYQEKAIGYGTLILFFVVMPLFLYWRYSKKYLRNQDEDLN